MNTWKTGSMSRSQWLQMNMRVGRAGPLEAGFTVGKASRSHPEADTGRCGLEQVDRTYKEKARRVQVPVGLQGKG